MSYPLSYYVMCHAILCHMSSHIMSYMSSHIMSYPMSHYVMYKVTLCHVPRHLIPFQIILCHVPCHISYFISIMIQMSGHVPSQFQDISDVICYMSCHALMCKVPNERSVLWTSLCEFYKESMYDTVAMWLWADICSCIV